MTNSGNRAAFTQSLDRLMGRITKPVLRKRGFAEQRILTEWDRIVGSALAQFCQPQKLSFDRQSQSDGRLYVLCEPAWALELQHLEPVVLDKLAGFFGYRAISKLVIKQGPLPAKPKKTVSEKETGEPIVTIHDSEIARVGDDALRNALQKLAAQVKRNTDESDAQSEEEGTR